MGPKPVTPVSLFCSLFPGIVEEQGAVSTMYEKWGSWTSVVKIKILVNLEVDHRTYRPLKLLVEEDSFAQLFLQVN